MSRWRTPKAFHGKPGRPGVDKKLAPRKIEAAGLPKILARRLFGGD